MSKILQRESEMFYRNHPKINRKERENDEKFNLQINALKTNINKIFEEKGEEAALSFAQKYNMFSDTMLCREDLIALFEEVKEEHVRPTNIESNSTSNTVSTEVQKSTQETNITTEEKAENISVEKIEENISTEKITESISPTTQENVKQETTQNVDIVTEEKTEEKVEEKIEEVPEKINQETKIETNLQGRNNLIYLTSEQMIDYENQPFVTDNEEDNEELVKSIKQNGIIEPIIVRYIEDKEKYQILSGHRRRLCGLKAGLENFPCVLVEKDDDEAALYLVDTNLITRTEIKASERAKAYKLKKQAIERLLKNKKTNEKLNEINEEILENFSDTSKLDLRQTLSKENQVSTGIIQRYLRVNYLSQDLQNDLDNKKISLKTAEHLSFLGKKEQGMLHSLIADENKKISDLQAKKIKELYKEKDFKDEKINILDIKNIIEKKEIQNKEVTIKFSEEEINQYFGGIFDKEKLKSIFIENSNKFFNIGG